MYTVTGIVEKRGEDGNEDTGKRFEKLVFTDEDFSTPEKAWASIQAINAHPANRFFKRGDNFKSDGNGKLITCNANETGARRIVAHGVVAFVNNGDLYYRKQVAGKVGKAVMLIALSKAAIKADAAKANAVFTKSALGEYDDDQKAKALAEIVGPDVAEECGYTD